MDKANGHDFDRGEHYRKLLAMAIFMSGAKRLTVTRAGMIAGDKLATAEYEDEHGNYVVEVERQ